MKSRMNLRLSSLLLLLWGAVQFVSAYKFESGGVYYNITSETNMTAAVTYFNKTGNTYSGIVSIPPSVVYDGNTYTVTSIGDYAFVGCTSLKGIKITEKTTTIGNYVFSGCNGMTEFTVPTQITSIGNYAFSGCSGITSITIKESDEKLELGYNGSSKGLFADCPLQSVFIGRPLSYNTNYGYSPFANNKSLEKVHLGNPVARIQDYLFYGCTALKEMKYNQNCKPTAVGSYAFYGCKSLTWDALALPESVKTIENNAFENCTGFTTIVIKPNITSIENNAFTGCTSITGFPIEESDETLSLGHIGSSKGLFADCPLQSVFIGRPLSYNTNYGYSPFANNKSLEKVHLGNPVARIQNYLFYGCTALKEMKYNQNCKPTAVGSYAFYGCKSLTWDALALPESVKTIENNAFENCTGFTTIVIKPNITSIENNAFTGCTSITGFPIEESDETLSLGHIGSSKGLFADCPLQSVFIGRPLSYNTNYGYSPFANNKSLEKVHLGNPVARIQDYLFYGCTALKEMKYNQNCKPTAVGSYAFYGCKSLTWDALALPESVKTIENNAFENCTGFTTIVIKPNITSIENNAFTGCTSLTGITIEDDDETLSLGHIGSSKGLFADCPLQSVFIGRPLNYNTNYGYSPFANIKSLEKASLGNLLSCITSYLLYGCKALKDITIPSKATSIGQYALANCSAMVELTSKSVVPPTCKNNAFDGIDKSTCKLIVPEGSITDYQSAAQWKEFLLVEEKEFGDDAGKEKCATPTIAFADGKLTFATATEGADCVWTLSRSGGNSGRRTTIEAPSVFELTVYATKEGWKNSDHVTALLAWGDADVEGDNVIRLGGASGVNYDLNNDGAINTADVVVLVNIIMNGGQQDTPASR